MDVLVFLPLGHFPFLSRYVSRPITANPPYLYYTLRVVDLSMPRNCFVHLPIIITTARTVSIPIKSPVPRTGKDWYHGSAGASNIFALELYH